MILEPEAGDIVGVIGEDNAIKYSIVISLKRIADTLHGRGDDETIFGCLAHIGDSLEAINERQRDGEPPKIDLEAIAFRVREGLE